MGLVRTPRKIKTSANHRSGEVKTGRKLNPNANKRTGTVMTGSRLYNPHDNDQTFTTQNS